MTSSVQECLNLGDASKVTVEDEKKKNVKTETSVWKACYDTIDTASSFFSTRNMVKASKHDPWSYVTCTAEMLATLSNKWMNTVEALNDGKHLKPSHPKYKELANSFNRIYEEEDEEKERVIPDEKMSSSRKPLVKYSNSTQRPTQHESLLTLLFPKMFWSECSCGPLPPLKLENTTLWQHAWHLYDPQTVKIRWQRMRYQLYGNQPDARQMFNDPSLCNVSPLTWRYAWKSHIELTCFSIENVPYISQVVVETDNFRLDMPFNVQFLRLPLFVKNPNQCITLWFNSTYGHPYERCYAKQLYSGNVEDLLSEEEHDGIETIKYFENNSLLFYHEYKNKKLEKVLLNLSKTSMEAKEYHPRNNGWNCYFKFVIPVSEIISNQVIETSTLIAPQGIFYDNHDLNYSTTHLFHTLVESVKYHPLNPVLKFCAKSFFQGVSSVVYCGNDTTPKHLLEDTPCLNSHVFDVATHSYEFPSQASRTLTLRHIYIGNVNDVIDLHVAKILNRLQQNLLQVAFHIQTNNQEPILRLCRGVYTIYGDEVQIEILKISTTCQKYDLQKYQFERDGQTVFPSYPNFLLLPFVFEEDFYQPLPDYIHRHCKNLTFLPFQHFSIQDILNEIPLPNLSLENLHLPYEAMNNRDAFIELAQHAEAIKKNLIRIHLALFKFTKNNPLLHDYFNVEKYAPFLQPPFLCCFPSSPKQYVTFEWDYEFIQTRIVPLPSPLPYYLKSKEDTL